jgi:hypothetical protein
VDFTSPCEPNGKGQDLTIDDVVVAPDRHARFIRSLQGHDPCARPVAPEGHECGTSFAILILSTTQLMIHAPLKEVRG